MTSSLLRKFEDCEIHTVEMIGNNQTSQSPNTLDQDCATLFKGSTVCSGPRAQPHVAVLLCSYNGMEYLGRQIASIQEQLYDNWSLHISDDGSTDGTLNYLQEIQEKFSQKVHLYEGPRGGYVKNFLSLIENPDINADYFALSDQDDIWLPEHLQRGIENLAPFIDQPALYCGRTELIDASGKKIGLSTFNRKKPTFKNALVQNIAGGNTMVMNGAAKQLLKRITYNSQVIVHDWYLYLIISATGGVIIYDHVPTVQYRQHNNNMIGAGRGLINQYCRLRYALAGQFKNWNDANLAILLQNYEKLTVDARKTLDFYVQTRRGIWLRRVWALRASGVYRQSITGSLSLWLYIILGKA